MCVMTLMYLVGKLQQRSSALEEGRENCARLHSNRKDRHELVLRYALECPVTNPRALKELERLNYDVVVLDPKIRALQAQSHRLEQKIDDDIYAILTLSATLQQNLKPRKKPVRSRKITQVPEVA